MRAWGPEQSAASGSACRADGRGPARRLSGLHRRHDGGWALARYVLTSSGPSRCGTVFGALSGALLALAAGWWGLREVLRRPVVETLRRRHSRLLYI